MPTLCPLRRILREGSKTSWYECADNTVKVNNPTGCLLKFSINRSKRDENQSCRTFDEMDDLFCHVLSQIKGIEGCSYFLHGPCSYQIPSSPQSIVLGGSTTGSRIRIKDPKSSGFWSSIL